MVTGMCNDAEVMTNEQEGKAHIFLKFLKQIQYIRLDRDIECRYRFIGHDVWARTSAQAIGFAAAATGEGVRERLDVQDSAAARAISEHARPFQRVPT
ncbi:MAG: hypothetical protein CM15mP60_2910 [Alphaproteobacteria bacterium]|nr:MAG: hypothetical protein CM15mP60_2910 [Alphaproteobacteria bacterium]